MNRVLVLNDDNKITENIKNQLTLFQVDCFNDPKDALEHLDFNHYHLIVSNLKMTDMNGIEFLKLARQKDAYDKAVLITEDTSKEFLIEAVNQGLIHQVIEEPLDLPELAKSLESLQTQVMDEMHLLSLGGNPKEGRSRDEKVRLIGVRGDMAEIYQNLKNAATEGRRIVFTGAPGTGKEVQARAYHDLSSNRRGKFIKIQCGSVPEAQLKNVFFGQLSGKTGGKVGAIALASGGTLFLDDINDLSMNVQKLLKQTLIENAYTLPGSDDPIKINFQLVCASRCPLLPMVEKGKFDGELLELLGGRTITIPPLKERNRDLKRFILYFVEKYSLQLGRMPLGIHKASIKKLKNYDWPGNISELEGVLKRAVVLTDPAQQFIPEEAFDFLFHSGPHSHEPEYQEAIQILARSILNQDIALKEIEHNILETIVQYTGGSITRAVDRSGIPKDRFYRYFKTKSEE